jgi:RNA ligase (TIGR02306 family)
MDRKLVTIEEILEIKPIEGADKIEVARVRDWWVVVKKNQFKVGDLCIYYEIDSFLPVEEQYQFLLDGNRTKRMMVDGEEREGIVLKTKRLRGQVSQGLIMPLQANTRGEVGTDLTAFLNVLKYEKPIPGCSQNLARGNFPSFLVKTDEERIQNCSKILELFPDTKCYITEKLDGTSVTFYNWEGRFGVCSRNMDLLEGDSVYWQIAKKYDLANRLPEGLCIQGEIIGEGIQKNPLKRTGQEFYIFNVYDINDQRYHSYYEIEIFCNAYGMKMVPVITKDVKLSFTVDQLLDIANNTSYLNGNVLREGIVVRSMIEQRINERNCPNRLSFKVINNEYLLKGGE